MEEETKKKIKKIAKVSGFIITFGFAVFGALCAAMLMANGSGAKDDIKTLDSSLVQNEVRLERNSKPRKADNEVYNYFEHPTKQVAGVIAGYSNGSGTFEPQGQYTTKFYAKGLFKSGVYRFTYEGAPNEYNYYTFWAVKSDVLEYAESAEIGPTAFSSDKIVRRFTTSDDSVAYKDYYYIDFSNIDYLMLCTRNGEFFFKFELVDALELPASSSVYLGENWNPLKAFGDNLSPKGGYLIRNQNWTYGTFTLPSLQLSGLLFKYEGEVFDRINITLYPLNASHTPYVDSTGNVVTPSDNSGTQEIYALQSVSFSQSWHNVADLGNGIYLKYSVPVLSASRADTPVGGKYPYNGSVIWASQSRTIGVIDDKGTTGERFDNRFLGMTDLELVKFLSQYQSEAIDVVNTGGMFSLFTNAFNSLTPILSIAILPNITLGMILFIPLVGGIIVVIIRLVKK